MTLTPRELALISNTDVLGYIQAENAERNAQAKAEGWQFWTLMAEELAEQVDNVYELELRFAQGTYSDVFKEWSGCRPHSNYGRMTLVELEGEINWMSRSIEESIIQEREWAEEDDRRQREEIALGVKEPGPKTKLEQWEIYEAKAEESGHGA
jgi:hypothetical protein